MQRDLRNQVSGSLRDLSLAIGEDVWRMYVYGVTRVGSEIFIQTLLVGPRTCSVVIRVAAGTNPRLIAREALRLVREFLASDHESEHVFLESAALQEAAC